MVPYSLGDRVRIHVKPGEHPAAIKEYKAEGTVVAVFNEGDTIGWVHIRTFSGTYRMRGPSRCDRFVIQKDNAGFVWIPCPTFRFCRKI